MSDGQPQGAVPIEQHLADLREHVAAAQRISEQLGDAYYAVVRGQPMWIAVEQMRLSCTLVLRGWNLANYFLEEAAKKPTPAAAAPAQEKRTWRSRLRGSSQKS